jgi:hypothetical protein
MTRIDQNARDVEDYFNIYLCIMKDQRNDQEESKWKPPKGSQNNVNDGVCQIKMSAYCGYIHAKMTVNRASTIFGPTSWEITPPICCSQS